MNFNLRHLGGQHLSEADISELKEFTISCGYQHGSMLFSRVDEEIVGCIRDHTGAKIISTLFKSIGFPKLEKDISCYRRQHIIGSLFYSNFKLRLLCKLSLVSSCWFRYSNFSSFFKSLLLSKALKIQQDDKDRKNEVIVKGFEDKIRKLEDSLKEKDSLLHSTERSLAEARAQNEKLSKVLNETQTLLEENTSQFSH